MTEPTKQVPPCIHSHERWKLISRHFAGARISILICDYCGWVDTEAAIEDALRLASPRASAADSESAERTLHSIVTMLGWENMPPRETLERDIAALKARASAAPIESSPSPGAEPTT